MKTQDGKIRSRDEHDQQHRLWFTSETNGTYDSPLKPRIYITSESYQFRLEHIALYSQVPCTVVPGGLIAPQIRAQMGSCGVSSQPVRTAVHIGAQINFGDLTPYLTYG
jgi:hypothetical protein